MIAHCLLEGDDNIMEVGEIRDILPTVNKNLFMVIHIKIMLQMLVLYRVTSFDIPNYHEYPYYCLSIQNH